MIPALLVLAAESVPSLDDLIRQVDGKRIRATVERLAATGPPSW